MKQAFFKLTGMIGLALVLSCWATATAEAQEARLQIDNLNRLEDKATQVIDINVDERLIQLALKFFNPKNPDEVKVKEAVAGLKGIYVKSFEFDKENEYLPADIQNIRAQLSSPRWSRMVDVRSKRDNVNVEVYMMLDGNNIIHGIAVLASEAKQLTIVNIIGPIDIDKLSALSGKFHIPDLDLTRDGDSRPKPKE